jgi:hypothetical protein
MVVYVGRRQTRLANPSRRISPITRPHPFTNFVTTQEALDKRLVLRIPGKPAFAQFCSPTRSNFNFLRTFIYCLILKLSKTTVQGRLEVLWRSGSAPFL